MNCLRLRAGKVVGSGSFGCVISPAIVFDLENSEFNRHGVMESHSIGLDPVKFNNSNQYVTKIVLKESAVSEWNSQLVIKDVLDEQHLNMVDYGIFPLAIHCLGREYVQKLLGRFKHKIPSVTKKRQLYTGLEVPIYYHLDSDKDSESCNIDPNESYCGIQIKKFLKNGDEYTEETKLKKKELLAFSVSVHQSTLTKKYYRKQYSIYSNSVNHTIKKLYAKLIQLLNLGIFHNDIKPDNLALLEEGDLVFADWGLSLVFRPETDYRHAKDENYSWIVQNHKYFSYIDKPTFNYYFLYLSYCFGKNQYFNYFYISNLLRFHLMVVYTINGDQYKDYSEYYFDRFKIIAQQLTGANIDHVKEFLRTNY